MSLVYPFTGLQMVYNAMVRLDPLDLCFGLFCHKHHIKPLLNVLSSVKNRMWTEYYFVRNKTRYIKMCWVYMDKLWNQKEMILFSKTNKQKLICYVLLIFEEGILLMLQASNENIEANSPIPKPYFSALLLLVGYTVLDFIGDSSDPAGPFWSFVIMWAGWWQAV